MAEGRDKGKPNTKQTDSEIELSWFLTNKSEMAYQQPYSTNVVGTSSNTDMARVSQQQQYQGVPYQYGYQGQGVPYERYPYGYGYEYTGNAHYPYAAAPQETGNPHYPYATPPQAAGNPHYQYAAAPPQAARYPHYPYAAPAPQQDAGAPYVNVVVNINPNPHYTNQGHNNNYDHPEAYRFQPATPAQPQHQYYYQQVQLQQAQAQPQPGRLEIMQGQRSRSGSGRGAEVVPDEYNLPGFITQYANAKFFVIKSSSKENLLSSIRHGVWTSTSRGNRKLNAAYAEAASGPEQTVEGGASSASSSNCPIFLLFSVSSSKFLN